MQNQWKRAKQILLLKLARTARDFFKEGFDKGGFTNRIFKKWAPKRNGQPSYLKKTGRLQRETGIIRIGQDIAQIGNISTPYAGIHNEGIGNMPERKFVGNSEKLNHKLTMQVREEMKEAVRQALISSFRK